jgi:hypothetical protein
MGRRKAEENLEMEMEAGKEKKTYAEKNRERTEIITGFISVLQKSGYDPDDVKGYNFGEMKAITKFLATQKQGKK